jgi:hypothetical protein
MNELYSKTLHSMGLTLRKLESKVLPPQKVPFLDSFVYRYVEKTVHQAMVQKLARVISGLHAARLLLENGFVQEQGIIQRVLDELNEYIWFLAYSILQNDLTPLHVKYLDAFYIEEFYGSSPKESTQKRPMVSRDKIRAYVSRADLAGINPSDGVKFTRSISKAYSGYVHGASQHIMDMYGGNPPHFHVHGMRGTERQSEHRYDLWNYFFRGIISFAVAAKAFDDEELFREIYEYHLEFDRLSGRDNAFQPDGKP